MLHRIIYDALSRGWGAYQAGGVEIYSDLFGRIYGLADSEIAEIQKYFQRLPPRIRQGFPRDDIDAHPACYIFMQQEQQPGFALNDFGGFGGAPVTPQAAGYQLPGVAQQPAQPGLGGAAFILSSLWTHQYQILGLARGAPEPVMWLAEVNKSILLAAKNFFLSRAMQSVVLAASDVQFREDLAPADLFARAVTLQCGREFSQADTSQQLQQAFQLQGLLLAPGSDSHPPGRPVSRVTASAPDWPTSTSGNDSATMMKAVLDPIMNPPIGP